ncbi:MAG: glycoside hydrolase family 88 protein [Clostridia bacterium]|nr:glycoside hydrolase family 88 protein [Clostridia bacterium]
MKKTRLLALFLTLVLLFNCLLFTGCSVLFPDTPDEPTDEPITDDPGTGDPTDDPTDDPTEDPGKDPEDDKEPGKDWFDGVTTGAYRISREKLEATLALTLAKVDFCIENYDGGFPGAYSSNDVYSISKKNQSGWVQGFWPGVLWHAYELSGDVKYLDAASGYVDSFYTRIDEKLGVDNHDMGFLFVPSCVSAYELTGDERAKEAAIMAADQLLTRYHEDAGFIQAWGTFGDEAEYRLIIDCLVNLSLLYWASEVTGDAKYANVATTHFESTLKTCYRENGSTFHTYFFDPETKEPSHGATKQGASDDSSWARGQSWAMYGPVFAYAYTGSEVALEYFKKATNYFISKLPADMVPYWDLIYGASSGEPRDSSAGAIAVCAILEGCKYLEDSDPDKAKFLNFAHRMMNSLIDNYATTSVSPDANGLLTGATQNRKTEKGVEEMTPFSDYFYIEALHRMLDPEWEMYW